MFTTYYTTLSRDDLEGLQKNKPQDSFRVYRREHLVHHLSQYILEVPIDNTYVFYYKRRKEGVIYRPLRAFTILDRWTPQVQRLFAADAAQRVVHLAEGYEEECRNILRTVRKFALGQCTKAELAVAYAEAESILARGAFPTAAAAKFLPHEAAMDAAELAIEVDAQVSTLPEEHNHLSTLLWQWLDGSRTANDVRRELAE